MPAVYGFPQRVRSPSGSICSIGIDIDRENRTVRLSKVFKWYAEDFGATIEERLRFIAPFLYDEDDRAFLETEAEAVSVTYQPYDWRLNRD